ncbi:MAG: hypothetical protein ACFE9Z_02570 [Promethearchaeota archaeon]
MKKKLKVTKPLIAVSFLIGLFAVISPVMACGTNGIFFIAIGDDLDLDETSNLVMAKIDLDGEGGIPTADVIFYSKIYESGEKVYAMTGILRDGLRLTTEHYFYCPVFFVWFINVWWFMGDGVYKTTNTNYDITYRNFFPITMPNTGGDYVSTPMLMFLSLTAEYCLEDPGVYSPGTTDNPIYVLEEGPWVLVAVLCGIIVETPTGPTELPIGPVSSLTVCWEY